VTAKTTVGVTIRSSGLPAIASREVHAISDIQDDAGKDIADGRAEQGPLPGPPPFRRKNTCSSNALIAEMGEGAAIPSHKAQPLNLIKRL
jgi:hypothetical protein